MWEWAFEYKATVSVAASRVPFTEKRGRLNLEKPSSECSVNFRLFGLGVTNTYTWTRVGAPPIVRATRNPSHRIYRTASPHFYYARTLFYTPPRPATFYFILFCVINSARWSFVSLSIRFTVAFAHWMKLKGRFKDSSRKRVVNHFSK